MSNVEDILDAITSSEATQYFKVRTWRATASTWFTKVSHTLRALHDATASQSTKHLLGDEAGRVVVNVLRDSLRLVPLLRDDTIYDFDWVERELEALTLALRNERKARKLENVEGRTPEEARAFLDKAANLRQDAGT